VGVPVGGTAGQFLQKTTTGVDYATDWTTVNLSVYAVKANNLSDLPSAPDARTNLGLGTMATATASDYSTTVAANGLYYPLSGNPSGFLTASSLTGYATESWVTGQGYITSAALTPYITSATATASFYPLSGNPSGFLTSAPVTSVAGRTGAITLSNTDISGLGSLAVVNDAPSDGSQYARKNAAWDVVISGDRYLTSSTTSNTVSNGNKTFTIGTGLSYTPTQNITISYDASNHMHGEVLTYNSGTGVLTVDVNHHTGSGTYASWVVNVGGVTPATSVAWGAITGTLSAQTDLQSALDLKLAATTAATTYYPLSGNPSAFLVAADITGKANIASPSLTGTPLSTTAAVDTNTTQIATTAFVVGQAGLATPLVDGTAAVGTSLRYARQDHVHGTDTTRLATANNLSELSATASTARTNLGLGTAAVEPATKLVPAGGTTGQALVKLSNSDWDDGWATITGPTLSANQTWTGVNEFSNGSGTFGDSTSGGTINISNGLISTGSQSVNICQNGQLGSTTTINIGTTNQNGLCTINTAGALVLSPGGGGNTAAPLRFSSLSTPTTFTDGDVWMTGSGLSLRLSGVSQQVALLGTVQTFTGNKTFSGSSTFTGLVSTRASTAVDGAGFRIVPGIAPTTAVAGDVWINTGVLGTISFRNSTTVQTCAVLGLANQNFTASGIQFSGATVSLGTSTAASTTNVASGATLAATTKTVNIGTNGVATSVTNINVGSATSTTTINLNGTVNAAGLSNGVKAWVNFNGIGTVAIRASYNVSSITDNGVGDYTVNFTTALADVNYAVSSTSNRIAATTQFVGMSEGTRAVGSIQVFSNYGASGVLDTDFINVTIIR
jgi:hypothetical protein